MLKPIDQEDIPTLEESREALGAYLEQYHVSPHRGLDGATPLSVWRTAVCRSVRFARQNMTPHFGL